jgi:hypothetical protein
VFYIEVDSTSMTSFVSDGEDCCKSSGANVTWVEYFKILKHFELARPVMVTTKSFKLRSDVICGFHYCLGRRYLLFSSIFFHPILTPGNGHSPFR